MVLPENLNDAQREAIITCLKILAEIGADGIEGQEHDHRIEVWIEKRVPRDYSAEKTCNNPKVHSV